MNTHTRNELIAAGSALAGIFSSNSLGLPLFVTAASGVGLYVGIRMLLPHTKRVFSMTHDTLDTQTYHSLQPICDTISQQLIKSNDKDIFKKIKHITQLAKAKPFDKKDDNTMYTAEVEVLLKKLNSTLQKHLFVMSQPVAVYNTEKSLKDFKRLLDMVIEALSNPKVDTISLRIQGLMKEFSDFEAGLQSHSNIPKKV